MSTAKKKSRKGLKILIIVLLILAILGLAFKFLFYDTLKEKTADLVYQKVAEQISEDSEVAAEYDQLSEEDQQTVEDIVTEAVSAQDIPELYQDYQNGDTQALIDYADTHLTDEQKQELYAIYLKYQ